MGNKESKVDLSSHLKEEEEIGFDRLKKVFEEYKEDNQKTIPKELGLHLIYFCKLIFEWKNLQNDFYAFYTVKKKKKLLAYFFLFILQHKI